MFVYTCRLAHLSVRLSEEYCGKTAEWLQMPFGVVSGVSRGMGDGDAALPKLLHGGVVIRTR